MPSAEILAVLADEVVEMGEAITQLVVRLADAGDETSFAEAAAEYAERVERVALASETLNLAGLKHVCDFVTQNARTLKMGDLDTSRTLLFERWPQLVIGYLKAPRDGVYSRELADICRRPEWPYSLDPSASLEIEQLLFAVEETENDVAAEPARATEARAEDVALDIPDDVNQKLVDAFLTEGPQQAAEYSALIQRIVRGDGWSDELNECRRLIHALKGSANTVSVRGVATLSHHVEDLLEYLAKNSLLPQGRLAKLLVKVADTLEMMFEALTGVGDAPADAQTVLQEVLDIVNSIDQGGYDPAEAVDGAGGTVAVAAPAETSAEVPAGEKRAVAKPAETIEPKVRVDVRTVDNMLRTSGELTISCGHVMERVQQAMKVIAELRERQGALWDRSSDMESFVSTQGIAAGRRQALAAASNAGSPSGFDPLEMDQYNELHTHVHGLIEAAADLRLLGARLAEVLTAVEASVRQNVSLNHQLHDLLMLSRMVPAGQLESRLQRTVRQAAEQCGKQVLLRVQGADVMLDDHLMSVLVDPLQHLLRNAIDHGLEAPVVRAEIGKSPAGEIVLTFQRDGRYLVVTCRDDGAGLDLARIYDRALKQGLIQESQQLGEDEIARLILRPGFSTAEAVTQVSGRGVGMDIVHSAVLKLKGNLDIRSEAGRGATFTLRLPISLGLAHCLLVAAEDETFALPSTNLEQLVHGGARHVQRTEDGWHYSDGTLRCPAHFLARLTGVPETATTEERERHVVIVNDGAGKVAVVVDGAMGGQDLVIKKPGPYLSAIKGLVGASILGNGSVVPILDLAELLRMERGEVSRDAQTTVGKAAAPDVLIVDDSLSVRTALSTLLTDEGFRVRTAKDGVEAIEAIDHHRPAVVLADLEMPRMNGLELTAHIRANASTRDLPVIMLTSRTAEKHRRQAVAAGVDDYVTKPYRENDLLLRLRAMLNKKAA
ncbi:MAG: response regulator [Sulfurifustis sp.]